MKHLVFHLLVPMIAFQCFSNIFNYNVKCDVIGIDKAAAACTGED